MHNILDTTKYGFLVYIDFIMREVDSINIALKHSLLEVIGKKLGKKKAQFNYFDKSYI